MRERMGEGGKTGYGDRKIDRIERKEKREKGGKGEEGEGYQEGR